MNDQETISLFGCQHDVLGHALKAIGVLRALAECGETECDSNAEGWWNTESGTFCIRSPRYPNVERLQNFFEHHYAPTPIFGPWTKGWGYQSEADRTLKKAAKAIPKQFRDAFELPSSCSDRVALKTSKTGSKLEVVCPLGTEDEGALVAYSSDAKWKTFVERLSAASRDIKPDEKALESLHNERASMLPESIRQELSASARVHEERKLMPEGKTPKAGRERSAQLTRLYLNVRDNSSDRSSQSLDAVAVPLRHTGLRSNARIENNPLFGDRGQLGRANIFRQYWACYYAFTSSPMRNALIRASLLGEPISGLPFLSAGTLFFPDTIKRYCHGTSWIAETPSYSPLDYILAVEGLFAISGSVAKSISATSPRYAAFPFVFESIDECTDNEGKPQGLSTDFFFPVWNREMTYSELSTTVRLFEARLSEGVVSNSTEFLRVFRAVAPDVGITAFRQFRIGQFGDKSQLSKSKSLVFVESAERHHTLQLLLSRLDSSGFIAQFPYSRDKDRPNLHPERRRILDAIESAATDSHPLAFLEVLESLAELNARVATSKDLRDRIGKARGRSRTQQIDFVPPLPAAEWDSALIELATEPEFEIARALASIAGHERQPNGKPSPVEPFLGSLVPLKRRGRDWILPMKPEPPSAQAVWSGTDLCFDLAAILARRYRDSAKDERPALPGRRSARLETVLRFLRGELDDRRIARLVMGLSLIDWQKADIAKDQAAATSRDIDEADRHPVPLPYAAIRTLIEVGINPRRKDDRNENSRSAPKSRSPQAISALCQRTPQQVTTATSEALRRLAIVGVENGYGKQSREQKKYLCGRDVVTIPRDANQFRVSPELAQRLAAAVLIPLDWRDRWTIFRSVTLPQVPKTKSGDTES